MASVTLLTGGSVPKGLESHTKERKVIRITDIVRKKNSMTNNEKLEKIKKLADDMYYAAANLGANVGSGERLRKTMEEYYKFIIHEYNKEEPKFKVGDYIKPVDSCLGSPCIIVEVCDSWYVTNQGTIDFEYEDNWELVEKYNITGIKSRHATGKLKECIDNQTEERLEQTRKQLEENPQECMYARDNYTDEDRKVLCDGCKEKCEYALKEEPVNEDFESALEKKVREAQDWTYIEEEGGECPLYEEFGADDLEEFARWGADWVRNNEKEPVSKELTDEIKSWLKQWSENEMEWSREDIWDTAEHFANWKKQQMMANAVDVTVHIDNGNYPYIPQMELYDYDKDIPLAKEGDKYKVVLIKED